jgi:hypothetical protein
MLAEPYDEAPMESRAGERPGAAPVEERMSHVQTRKNQSTTNTLLCIVIEHMLLELVPPDVHYVLAS